MNEIISYFVEHPYKIFYVFIPLIVMLSFFYRKAYYSNNKKDIRRYRIVHVTVAIIFLFAIICTLTYVWC